MDFSIILGQLDYAVVFTISSLHQVPLTHEDLYRAVFNIAEIVDCLHFEQIDWQIRRGPATAADRDYAVENDTTPISGYELKRSREMKQLEVRADIFGSQSRYRLSPVH